MGCAGAGWLHGDSTESLEKDWPDLLKANGSTGLWWDK